MQDFLVNESTEFENGIAKTDCELIDAIVTYEESYDMFHVVMESEKTSLIGKIKIFFADLVAAFQNFISAIKNKVSSKVREESYKAKLESLHKELREKSQNGEKKIKVENIWLLEHTYFEACEDLKKEAKRLCKMKYKYTRDIDKDIEVFNKKLKKYETAIEDCKGEMITVSISEMLDFVENEISGRSRIFKSLNDNINVLNQMKDDVILVATRTDMLGADIIPKHVSFLKKVIISITNFIRKTASKIISRIVFFCA